MIAITICVLMEQLVKMELIPIRVHVPPDLLVMTVIKVRLHIIIS